MSEATSLRVLLVDPSLFTAPYDAALSRGLQQAGVEPTWAVRPTRAAERAELADEQVDPFFYRWIEQQHWLPVKARAGCKGFAHALGLLKLVGKVAAQRPDVVHFQWTVLPLLDSLAMLLIRSMAPVVLTVHDTVPFNGERLSTLQNLAFDLPLRLSQHVIVHTRAGKARLVARGIGPEKLAVIPHGPLSLGVEPAADTVAEPDDRYCIVLFGELKPYKGLDVLVEALAQLSDDVRARCRCIVAGRARMDLAPLQARIRELGLASCIELRPERLPESAMATLFAQADCFVFPYRQIDASGVYFLVKSLGKWLIASEVGIFAEDLRPEAQGELVPAGDIDALSAAITRAVEQRPQPAVGTAGAAWATIGEQTRALYDSARSRFSTRGLGSSGPPTLESAT